MKASNFLSSYLKGDDLEEDEEQDVTIRAVKIEEIGRNDDKEKEKKMVVYFQEHERGLVIRSTNGKKLVSLFGEETDDWIGKRVTLFGVQTSMGPGIRIKAVK